MKLSAMSALCCAVFATLVCASNLSAQNLEAQDLDSTRRDQTVLVHYMPWYASKPVSGHWGWHWTMDHFHPERIQANGQREVASHDYPLIDLYDSNDPDALECQVLLMKLAGIDGVIIDWYGIKPFRDYAEIHRNSKHLIKHLKAAGLKFAVCYEDQTIKHMVDADVLPQQRDVAHGQEVLKWLADHWLGDDSYVKIDGRPILLVFGPQYFAKDQWEQIVSGLEPRPVLYGLPHLAESTGMDGAFGWPPVAGGREITPSDWRPYLTSLYAKPNASRSVVAAAFPGFRDIYQQAQLHDSYGSIDDRNGQTLAETFSLAQKSGSQIIQVATWNDYGEGTVIEPTKASQYRYLEHVQKNAKSQLPYGPQDLRLPVVLYQLKKQHAKNPARIQRLQAATDYLFVGKCAEARALIDAETKVIGQ